MTDDEVEQLIKEVEPVVRQIIWGYTRDPERVADLIQEHAMTVWRLRKDLNESANARAYVIGRMHWLGRLERHRSYQAMHAMETQTPLDPVTMPVGDESTVLCDLDLQRAFDKLPVHLWVVAWMVHGQGFLVGETARRLGLPRLLAEQRLTEATARLRSLLKDWR